MTTTILDPNQRTDPLFTQLDFIESETAQRIVKIAIPFLYFYAPAGLLITCSTGSIEIADAVVEVMRSYDLGNWTDLTKKSARTALLTTTLVLTAFYAQVGSIVSNGISATIKVRDLGCHLFAGEISAACGDTFDILSSTVYMGSIFYGGPALLALSLLMQASKEFYHSCRECQNGRLPETLANALLGMIRIYQAKGHIETLHRNHFGKKMTQEDWEDLYDRINSEKWMKIFTGSDDAWYKSDEPGLPKFKENLDLQKFLKEGNFSSNISSIDFRETQDLTQLIFKNMDFKKCDFRGAYFDNSRLFHVGMHDCKLQKASFIETFFSSCAIENSNLSHATFYRSSISDVTFSACNVKEASFNDSQIFGTAFKNCLLQESNFLFSKVSGSRIEDSNLTNTVLCGAPFEIKGGVPNHFTKPVIALGWNFKQNGAYGALIDEVIPDNDGITMRFEYAPEDLSEKRLRKEVNAFLKSKSSEGYLSIADAMLKQAEPGSEISRVKDLAVEMLRYADGVILPGGEDVGEEFYKKVYYFEDDNLKRSLLEFALIQKAHEEKVRMMGVCRGSQIINVFFGGTLKNVEGQHGFQELKIKDSVDEKTQNLFKAIIGNETFHGLSMHGQASDEIGKGLQCVIEYDDIPKALISEDRNFLLTQFHPEIYINSKKQLYDWDKIRTYVMNEYDDPKEQAYILSYLESYIEELNAFNKYAVNNQNFYAYFINGQVPSVA